MTAPNPKAIQAKKNGTAAECYLYGDIGGWEGITADAFRQAIEGLGEFSSLTMYVNSPGGSVFDGKAICAQLERIRTRAKVHAVVDGLAASAASFIAIACDDVAMHPTAKMMIHQPQAFAAGSSEDLRKMAELLDSESETLVDIYVKKCGASADQVRAWLAAETWFTAEEAVKNGLADSVVGEKAPRNQAPDSTFQNLVAATRSMTDQRRVALWRAQRTVEAMRAKHPRSSTT